MKYVVCVPDGCADFPLEELDGKTPLEAANTPVLDGLSSRAVLGRAQVIPEGMPPGSDVGNMAIFGYDPAIYHTGRAPIEAAAMGLKLTDDQVAFRCNFVCVTDNKMADFSGGHPDSETASKVIVALNSHLGNDEICFHPGVQYRHIMVAPKSFLNVECIPPHDISGEELSLPIGDGSDEVIALMEKSREVFEEFPNIKANQFWLWGQGTFPKMPSFKDTFKKEAGLVTAVDLVRGLGALTDMEVVEVEGATAWYDTNYEGKRDAALDFLKNEGDLFIVHIEASDEAGHAGDIEEKIKSLEAWDSRVLKDLVVGLDEMGEWAMLLLPDHVTSIASKTHTSDPVPYMLLNSKSTEKNQAATYTESYVAEAEIVPGHKLMGELLAIG